MDPEPGGIITKSLLKTTSGNFDLETIQFLNLQNLGIKDLGCIGECTELEFLDLSRNDVSKLLVLSCLPSLTDLDLSENKITSLEGLQALSNLEKLKLAGNFIESVSDLYCLTDLSRLKNLSLKNNACNLSNPVCASHDYKNKVLNMFPNLLVLDGEIVQGEGSNLFTVCREVDQLLEIHHQLSENIEAQSFSPTSLPENLFRIDTDEKFDNPEIAAAERNLKVLMNSCQQLLKQSTEKIQEVSQDMS